jgi:4,5-dihydroxyphthalate decarboxylase
MTKNPTNIGIALKRYPTTQALLTGKLPSTIIEPDFQEIEPIHGAFRPMVQQQFFDACEMAIFTFLQAITFKKPLVLLPVVLAARFQHPCIVYNKNFHDELTPAMLPGKKVGVRAYAQTTGAWIRNILSTEHGLPLEKIDWVTFEGGHLNEYVEPDFVTRAPEGSKLLTKLMSGELDAGILGNDLPDDPCIEALIPNARNAGQASFEKTGLVPINHMLVVKQDLADKHPEIVRELYRLFRESKQAAPANHDEPDLRPIGFEAIAPSLQQVVDLAVNQKLIPEKLSVDDLFANARNVLGTDVV